MVAAIVTSFYHYSHEFYETKILSKYISTLQNQNGTWSKKLAFLSPIYATNIESPKDVRHSFLSESS
ncbi:hypothetical protein P8452_61245 [Trifolium repens]|nr:hypothetical protein P8452_09239 [Trifolium repens]WJX77981.1 hypothetical protein P8452_61245 [Trifolium repens]